MRTDVERPPADAAAGLPDTRLDIPGDAPSRPPHRGRRRLGVAALIAVAGILLLHATGAASWASARLLARYAQDITFELGEGPSPVPATPGAGPHDVRLGYHDLPATVSRLEAAGFRITAQARVSARFEQATRLGFFPLYPEKTQGGLRILGRDGGVVSETRFPQRIYPSFESIPPPVLQSLLFLENRELLDDRDPYRNPAIEWDRLVAAVANYAGGRLLGGQGRFGASTLATQLEKVRHSPDGITRTPGDKARQMASATLRSYLGGPRTEDVRRSILTDYLNALPVGALPGYGEVIGLRDGLSAWFGLDPDSADAALRSAASGRATPEAARAYRGTLALLLAQRRPSWYLLRAEGQQALARLTDSHLRLMAEEAVVPPHLAASAIGIELPIAAFAPSPPVRSFVERKAANAVRVHLRGLLGASNLYQLDRIDMSVRATIDGAAQSAATDLIRQLSDRDFVRGAGLTGERLLGEADPAKVAYSFVLYERTDLGNAVRVQVDNLDRPFDLNFGARLELGSTAKLRTLVTYLEIVAGLSERLRADTAGGSTPLPHDPITRWARAWLAEHPEGTVREMLEAALERRYSANPSERFFTGGGVHVFGNFDDTHDAASPTVLEGFRHSVNLVFVRLMRDIVRYHEHRLPGFAEGLLDDPASPARREFLERYADAEGRTLIERFYRHHKDRTPEDRLDRMIPRNPSPARYARLLMAVAPTISPDELTEALRGRFPGQTFSPETIGRLRRGMPADLNLSDRAYLAGIHPLELWVVARLGEEPGADLRSLLGDGAEASREAHTWLFRRTPAVRRAQDRAIRIMLEREAFKPIRESWRRLGYPYDDMVPSLGTSIGSSGDRPGALAEVVGILLGEGGRRPVIRVEEAHFAEGTPFETVLRRDSAPVVQVLPPDVAAVARAALADVVERGTGGMLRGALTAPDGTPIVIGGKTGTGHNQIKTFGPGGRQTGARTVSRTATFVFYLGDRFYGVATAYVDGPAAAEFRFTSGLPVRIVSLLLPRLSPLWTDPGPSR